MNTSISCGGCKFTRRRKPLFIHLHPNENIEPSVISSLLFVLDEWNDIHELTQGRLSADDTVEKKKIKNRM
jgi:hypothetical protein